MGGGTDAQIFWNLFEEGEPHFVRLRSVRVVDFPRAIARHSVVDVHEPLYTRLPKADSVETCFGKTEEVEWTEGICECFPPILSPRPPSVHTDTHPCSSKHTFGAELNWVRHEEGLKEIRFRG